MERYNFDKIIDRKGTDAVKTDGLKETFGDNDLLPLWVADMDFPTPDFILNALRKRLEHPILGYPTVPDSYFQTLKSWLDYKHHWKVEKEWLTYIPGIVKGMGLVLQVFSDKGDKVIIQPPVYHPFRLVPEKNEREIVWNPLIYKNGTFEMDFENLEKVIDSKCKILILCNPHNPGGTVWDKQTLIRLAEICKKHDILVISDEIHAEMAHEGFEHIPFATVSEEAANNSITFLAPSKTFNIAGIVSSYAVVPNTGIREKFYSYLEANEFNAPSIFSIVATQAAYNEGKEWLKEMMAYIRENIDYVDEYLKTRIPAIKAVRPQASFLIWLDCRGLGLSQDDLVDLFTNKARLALNDGSMFGPGGEGHMRLNIGCPRALLEKALNQLEKAVNGISRT